MKKGEIYCGTVYDTVFPRKGKVKVDDTTVFVEGSNKYQNISFRIIKKKSKKVEGKLISVDKKADYEIEPLCSYFNFCGGCSFANIPYDMEIDLKETYVKELLNKSFFDFYGENNLIESTFKGTNKAVNRTAYRNKMEYTFGDSIKDGPIELGLHKRYSSYDIITVDDCSIVHNDFLKILKFSLDFAKKNNLSKYHRMNHTGELRHLLIRRSCFAKQILVGLVTTSECKTDFNEFSKELLTLDLEGKIVSVLHIINDSLSDAIKADSIKILYGNDYIYEKLSGLNFKISVFSFFQTNSKMAEVLYSRIKKFAGDLKNKVVLDLYCGTGSIAQILAEDSKFVIGIELVKEAVEAAEENAKLNNIKNCEFIAGDVGEITKILNSLRTGNKEIPITSFNIDQNHISLLNNVNTIILDPPREGLRPNAIDEILSFDAKDIIYVSCKPTSLAKDITYFLDAGYELKNIELVDMFPATQHIETIVLLSKLDVDKHIDV